MKRIVLQPIMLMAFLLFYLSACNAQTPEPTATIEPTDMPLPSATASVAPTSTPEATATPEPTVTLEPPTPSPAITETSEPITPTVAQSVTGSTRISEVDQMEQIFIPAGEFIMGSTDREAKQTEDGGRAYPEIPQHTVYLDGYWMDKYEVTTSQYALCVDAGVCDPPYLYKSETREHYYDNPDYADYPVIWVSWYMTR